MRVDEKQTLSRGRDGIVEPGCRSQPADFFPATLELDELLVAAVGRNCAGFDSKVVWLCVFASRAGPRMRGDKMSFVRSPIGRSAAIVTMTCAIALGNLATSSGSCSFFSCWKRTTWYFGGATPHFVVLNQQGAYEAWCAVCSGDIIGAPATHTVCGCIVNGCVCPCHLCCTNVPISVGSTSLGPTLGGNASCKPRR